MVIGCDLERIGTEKGGQTRGVVTGFFHRETEADVELVGSFPIQCSATGDGAAVIRATILKGVGDVALVFGEADAGAVADFVVERTVEGSLEGGVLIGAVVEEDLALMSGTGGAGLDIDDAAGGVATVVGALGAGLDGEALDVEQ